MQFDQSILVVNAFHLTPNKNTRNANIRHSLLRICCYKNELSKICWRINNNNVTKVVRSWIDVLLSRQQNGIDKKNRKYSLQKSITNVMCKHDFLNTFFCSHPASCVCSGFFVFFGKSKGLPNEWC